MLAMALASNAERRLVMMPFKAPTIIEPQVQVAEPVIAATSVPVAETNEKTNLNL